MKIRVNSFLFASNSLLLNETNQKKLRRNSFAHSLENYICDIEVEKLISAVRFDYTDTRGLLLISENVNRLQPTASVAW